MDAPIRTGIRSYVSSHVCRVRMPWFNDGGAAYQRFRREVTYNVDPPAPWYWTPVAGVVWFALSLRQSWRQLSKYGGEVSRREGIALWLQFARMFWRAFRRNQSPLDFYATRSYLGPRRPNAEENISTPEMRLFYDRVYGRVDSDILDRKDRFLAFCREHELPTIPIIHVAYGDFREAGTVTLPAQDLFSKPLNAHGGEGALLWRYDSESRKWSDGSAAYTQAELIGRLEELAAGGSDRASIKYAQLLQPRLINHPQIATLSRVALNTARVMTCRQRGGEPFLAISMLRIATDDSVIDTARRLVASIDLDTGVLGGGISPDARFPDGESHPLTNARIRGVQLPFWKEAVNLVLQAHRLAPPIPLIGWDVAFTPEGPCLVEANTCAAVDYVQLVNRCSFAQPVYVDALLSWLSVEGDR